MNTEEKAIIGIIALGAGGLALYYILKSKSATAQSTSIPSSTTSTAQSTGKNVSNLTICDPSIKNGDYVIVNNQADTGLSGTFTFIDVSDMQADARSAGECGANAAHWVWNHPFANGIYWTTP